VFFLWPYQIALGNAAAAQTRALRLLIDDGLLISILCIFGLPSEHPSERRSEHLMQIMILFAARSTCSACAKTPTPADEQ
jgi:hypothetical protein